MAIENTFEQINTLVEQLTEHHNKNISGNKAAGTRARKAAMEIKNLLTQYRKESVEAGKG